MQQIYVYNVDMEIDTTSLTITQALEDEEIRTGLTQACYRQIEQLESKINAFITVIPQEEITQSKGILAGIPIGIKDLYETAGVRTTSGSLFFKDFIPENDAVAVKKLKEAGANIIGKTSTHEIALGVTNINPHYGTPRNPWDTSCITGGSSGGSAAAVASGMCMAALGTDTGGSIRIPASLCGIVGLKPTYGRISTRGILPLSWNMDHAGPLTRSVKDAALLLRVLAGYDDGDPASVNMPVSNYLEEIETGVKDWQIALVTGEFIQAADPEILKAVQKAAEIFERLGAKVENVDVSWLHEAAIVNVQIVQADAAAFHSKRLEQHPELFGVDVRQRLEEGRSLSSREYVLARRKQAKFRRRCAQFFRQYDLILLPSTATTALPVEEIQNSANQAPSLTRFTAPFNITGLPAISLPCGFNQKGLPIGLQIVSGCWQEAKLLNAAFAYESATEWHKQILPI